MSNNYTGIISSVISDTRIMHPIEVSGNLRLDQHEQLGIPFYHLQNNPRVPYFRDIILEYLKQDSIKFSATVAITKDILDDDELFGAIREKIERDNNVFVIRIVDEDYTLTQEDFNKLSFAKCIAVDNCVEELNNEPKLVIQHGIFKYGQQATAQPVLERRDNFDDLESRITYHINHRLTEDEFVILARHLNSSSISAIELDYFDPSYYEDFLRGLQRHNVRNNINIQIIGYLLEDQLETYERLQGYPYEIDVVYSTCHDKVDMYQNEPYTENRLYYSQIEGGGKTSLQNYLNVLRVVHDFESVVAKGNLSPLETAILAKMQIDLEYIYDPDADFVDEWDNINLSQIINHEVDGKKRAVCMGFSTLYSALLRRSGIPMFRYSTTGHSRSIGRIKDEKYGVDTICTCDITFDLQSSHNERPTYTYFMVAPREYLGYTYNDEFEHMTIADTLALPIDEYQRVVHDTNLFYEEFYHPVGYEPMGYTARMLELMDVVPQEGIGIDVYDVIYTLCENGQLESIPQETILQAIDNVLQFLRVDQSTLEFYHSEAEESFDDRFSVYGDLPTIRGDFNQEYEVEPLTQDNVSEYRSQLPEERPKYYMSLPDDYGQTQEEPIITNNPSESPTNSEIQDMLDDNEDYIPGATIPKPRNREYNETEEEYVEYLRQYYTENFPNYRYLETLLKHVEDSNITIYDYYVEVADHYRNNEEGLIPDFEKNNPFIRVEDLKLLVDSKDERISLYFAMTLSKTVEKNLPQYIKLQSQNAFRDQTDDYLREIERRM